MKTPSIFQRQIIQRYRVTPEKMPADSQQGAALLVALVVLLAITLMGVTSLRSGLFHERMSLNSQADALTFMGAESGINGIMAAARRIGDQGNSESFFADTIIGKRAQTNCVTHAGLLSGACSQLSHALDTRTEGIVFSQPETEYLGERPVIGSDVNVFAQHTFKTDSTGYIRSDLQLPFANKNRQEWSRLGVPGQFSMNAAEIELAKQ